MRCFKCKHFNLHSIAIYSRIVLGIRETMASNSERQNLLPVTACVAPAVLDEIKKIQQDLSCSQSNAARILLYAGLQAFRD